MNLLDYFDDYLNVLNNIEIGKFIFLGRKGVGKSAIAKYIQDKTINDNESFATLLRISDFKLTKVIQSFSSEQTNVEGLIFEWLILINIVKLLVNSQCGIYTTEYKKIEKFLQNNTGFVDVDKFQITEIAEEKGRNISFGGLAHIFGGIIEKHLGSKLKVAPFYKLIPPLKEIVSLLLEKPVHKTNEFFLLFDDLDIDYDINNESDNNKVMELLRIAKRYNNEVFKNKNAKIIVFLRNDIGRVIESKYPDSAKILSSYGIPINWYQHIIFDRDESELPLKKMVNKRIQLNFQNHGINCIGDPWNCLFQSLPKGKSSFKYIIDYTFYRPRDIISFLSLLGNKNYKYPLSLIDINENLKEFVSVNIKEIKSELSLFFSEQEKIYIFDRLLPYVVSCQNIKQFDLLEKIGEFQFSMDKERVFEILYNYSFFVYRGNDGSLHYNYRENSELDRLDCSTLNIGLAKCIYEYYAKKL